MTVRITLLTALAATTLVAFSVPAQADVSVYKCKGHTVKLDVDDDTMAGTMTINGRVFSDAHLVDGCRYSWDATGKDGSTAHLCTATQGYAELEIAAKGKKPAHYECQMPR